MRCESHGFSCRSSEPPKEARKPQLYPVFFTFPSRDKWWLPGTFSMAQLCAPCSMRITGYWVEQWQLDLICILGHLCICFGGFGISVSVQDNFFPLMSRNQNRFLLNAQQIKVCYIQCFLFLWYDNGCPTEGHAKAAIHVRWRMHKFNFRAALCGRPMAAIFRAAVWGCQW